jgi:hypothetical protein
MESFTVRLASEPDTHDICSFLSEHASEKIEVRIADVLESCIRSNMFILVEDGEGVISGTAASYLLSTGDYELGTARVVRPKGTGLHRCLIAARTLLTSQYSTHSPIVNVDLGNDRTIRNLESVGYKQYVPSPDVVQASRDTVTSRHEEVIWLRYEPAAKGIHSSRSYLMDTINNLCSTKGDKIWSIEQRLHSLLVDITRSGVRDEGRV